ncbi:MAG TPA: OmpA family protein [Puia sp.]|nr:OmpA family protein [Puia sp.]
MKLKQSLLFAASAVFLFSCVSQKKFKAEVAKNDSLTAANAKLAADLKNCNDLTASDASKAAALQSQLDAANKQIDFLKQNHDATLKQLQDLSVISNAQAESIKKSLDNIGTKDIYIQNLQQELAHKDSLNMALVMNLKGALADVNDQDVNIKVDKGVVYIDISDKLLFASGKWNVTEKAKTVLGKVAAVLKAQPDIEFMVEGHTDNKPYNHPGEIKDNWDLSVKRATSVVRILQKQYGLDPAHITAAGRSEYVPVASNDTEEGRAANRRTRIVILPQLDQFFKLLEHK